MVLYVFLMIKKPKIEGGRQKLFSMFDVLKMLW